MAIEASDKARHDLRLRLSRVIGQLQGLQKRLDAGSSDCLADIQQIKAANNALAKVAETYVEIHLSECIRRDVPRDEIERNLQSVIRATFTM